MTWDKKTITIVFLFIALAVCLIVAGISTYKGVAKPDFNPSLTTDVRGLTMLVPDPENKGGNIVWYIESTDVLTCDQLDWAEGVGGQRVVYANIVTRDNNYSVHGVVGVLYAKINDKYTPYAITTINLHAEGSTPPNDPPKPPKPPPDKNKDKDTDVPVHPLP